MNVVRRIGRGREKMIMENKTRDQLLDELEEAQEECGKYLRTLERLIHRLAEIGLIENNPHTRMLYVEGDREL